MQTVSGTLLSLLAGEHIPLRLFARIEIDGDVTAVTDAIGDLTWDSQLYAGIGQQFAIQPGAGGAGKRPTAGSLILAATDPRLTDSAFLADYRAWPVEAGFLFVNSAGAYFEEFVLLSGRADNIELNQSGVDPLRPEEPTLSTATLNVAPIADQLARPGYRLRTDADQRKYRDPDDGALKDASITARLPINWGAAGAHSPFEAHPG